MFNTTKTLAIAATLLVVPASSAFAQGAYGVMANVQTLGMPGGFSDYSNGLPLDAFEFRESDPLGGIWGVAPNTVFADGAARAWAQPGELRVETDATADAHSKNTPSSYPYGFGETRNWDTLTVVSDTLPAGTPVTLVFNNVFDAAVGGQGLWAATFYAEQVIAGRTVYKQISISYTGSQYTTLLGDITVNTKVGSNFKISGRLYLSTRAFYYASTVNGPQWDGVAAGEVSLRPVFASASGDVRLVSASGVSYPLAGN